MSESIQRILYYVLGGVCGIAVGQILCALANQNPTGEVATLYMLATALLGALAGSLIYQYKRERFFQAVKEVRDETVALITHEMRTEITSTAWAIEVILEIYNDKLQSEHRKMLQDVLRSINTTVMHTVNLLDISLLDIGKLAISLEWRKLKDIEKFFAEIIERYKMGAERNGITFTSKVALDPERQVEVDMLRLRIIFENLLENAMQYTLGTVKKIDVVIENDSAFLKIKISDTGIGIPQAEQAKISSGFFRASNARKVLSTGSGIGLHMSYQYVRAHHGTIYFESKENAGTTFYISLPLKSTADVKEFLNKI